jgi:hypothetical protein
MAQLEEPLTPQRLLWVEGKDDQAVVKSLCEAHGIPEVFRVQEQGGLKKLFSGIGVVVKAHPLERFGVVVDANGNIPSRWLELRRVFEREGYRDLPLEPAPGGTILSGNEVLPRLGIWIMPDNGSPGALEDFAASLIPRDDRLGERAGEAIDSIPDDERLFTDMRRSKAHMHTWLAWQKSPGSPMGQAIGKGDLDAHALAAQRFVAWLRRLMVDETEGDRAG